MELKECFVIFNQIIVKKLEFVLEPLQAIMQLCFLQFCPVGTKLTIYDNLLYIQYDIILFPSEWFISIIKSNQSQYNLINFL